MSQHYQGVGGASGIVSGRIFRYTPSASAIAAVDEDPDAALLRLAEAQRSVSEQLATLAAQLQAEGHDEEAAILDTQALFAQDIAITDEVTRRIREKHEPLEPALQAAISQLRATFEAIDDAYLRERAADMEHIGRALLAALHGEEHQRPFDSLPPGAIVAAPDLTPAETAELRGHSLAGFATAYGGPTGHTAIIARSLGIPAVVGLGDALLELATDTEVILDGDAALLIAHPEADEHAHYQQRMAEQQHMRMRWQTQREQPGQMADGHRVALWANIGQPDEARLALEYGAEGIGLFRTEFLFLDRATPPTEEEHYHAYRATLQTMAGRTVVVRTLDIGGDKPAPYLDLPAEANPFLGCRGLRLCMRQPHLLQTQFRALLRAALDGDLWVMLPMISTPEDLAWGRAQLQQAAASLTDEGIEHRADFPLGAMVETPAAAVTVDLLAREAAFLSIGSNDLTQYTMAADRSMADLANSYPHTSPAVLRLIAQAAAAASSAGLPIGVCGELAGVPDAALLLAGLGITELSMAPALIPLVKERLLAATLAEAQQAARQATG